MTACRQWRRGYYIQLFVFCLLLTFALARADERVAVCFNYACLAQTEVVFSDVQLREIGGWLSRAGNAAEERAALGVVVGRLLGWAGEQSPIAADRGGNLADQGVYGKMDCIDHSTTATRLLRLLARRHLLRFHQVLEPAKRRTFLIFEHFAAQIEELAPPEAGAVPDRYVVDAWFFDNGHPAAVMPLAGWQAGETPDE